jgi:hypothetical protein
MFSISDELALTYIFFLIPPLWEPVFSLLFHTKLGKVHHV